MAISTLDVSPSPGSWSSSHSLPTSTDGRTSRHPSPPLAEDLKAGGMPSCSIDSKGGLRHMEALQMAPPPTSMPLSPPSDRLSSPALTDDAHLALSAEGPLVDYKLEDLTALSEASVHSLSPPAPPPPALSVSDAKSCAKLLLELSKHASAWPFKAPVDPTVAAAPDYFDIIKRPMDLSTVERKLSSLQYSEVQDFADDIQLMLNNCFTYNPPTNGIHKLGKSLEQYFSLVLSKQFPTITTTSTTSASSAATAAVVVPVAAPRRSSKRNIRAPKVFEPEDATPPKKAKISTTSNRRNSTTSAAHFPEDLESSDDEMGQQISTLATCLETINQQLAILTDPKKKSKRRRSSVSAPAPQPPVKRRRSSKAQVSRSSTVSPPPADEVQEDVHVAKLCEYCGTEETPMWRRGPSGCGTLCNKCGVKWRNGKIMGDNKLPPTPLRAATVPSRSKSKPRKGFASGKSQKTITYEQKTELSALIANMTEDKMGGVIEIIRSGLPHLTAIDDEIELDIDVIDGSTLCQLYSFVKRNSKPSRSGGVGKAATGPRGLASDEDESSDGSSSDSD
ncbi:hypothetical protein HKX48_000487 [Thoreauomyces humboldtii]|nr:hypothetical protein HKX48_000487 [Thoreauomyces humboldtii]